MPLAPGRHAAAARSHAGVPTSWIAYPRRPNAMPPDPLRMFGFPRPHLRRHTLSPPHPLLGKQKAFGPQSALVTQVVMCSHDALFRQRHSSSTVGRQAQRWWSIPSSKQIVTSAHCSHLVAWPLGWAHALVVSLTTSGATQTIVAPWAARRRTSRRETGFSMPLAPHLSDTRFAVQIPPPTPKRLQYRLAREPCVSMPLALFPKCSRIDAHPAPPTLHPQATVHPRSRRRGGLDPVRWTA
jgi:hypothetical protein